MFEGVRTNIPINTGQIKSSIPICIYIVEYCKAAVFPLAISIQRDHDAHRESNSLMISVNIAVHCPLTAFSTKRLQHCCCIVVEGY